MRSFSSQLGAVLWSILVASLIAIFGAGVWTALISTNLRYTPAIPWAVPVMALILWAMWAYLGGKGWPRRTAEARRAYLRANRLSPRLWMWSLLGSIASLIALAGLWIVLVELVGVGGNPTIPDYSQYPWYTVVLGLMMGSVVSPLTEEAAFRGYAQVKLERVFPVAVAVLIASLVFAFWHGPTQGFYWSKLLFYFIVGIAFGVTATLANSSLAALPAHILGDLTFFFLIWPFDKTRPLVWRDGANVWFWIHIIQAALFAVLAVLAFRRLARTARNLRTGSGSGQPIEPDLEAIGAPEMREGRQPDI